MDRRIHARWRATCRVKLHFALIADPTQPGVAYIAGSGKFNPTLKGLASENELTTIVRVNYDATTKLATYTPITFPGSDSSPHPDTRALIFNSNGNLLASNDGGVYALNNPQGSGSWTPFGGTAAGGSPLRAIEAYSAVMDPNTGRLAFASQDNGAGLSAPTATLSQIKPGAPWQNVLSGDGFSVAASSKTGGPSIFYATADDFRLARTFANENLSPSSPPNLLTINVAGTSGTDYFTYQNDGGANGIVVAVNAVDPTKLLFRSSRLYTWTDPGTALSGSINITDITTGHSHKPVDATPNLFGPSAWAEKIAYGTHDAPDAILAGGPLPGGGFGVYLRTQEQVNTGSVDISSLNQLKSFSSANDPSNVLFDPATEHKFFIADSVNVYKTNDTGTTLSTLTLPGNLKNPTGLGYIADSTGGANNGVRALLVGGTLNTAGSQRGIFATLDPFASSVQWMNLAPGLANAGVQDLHYYPDIDTLVAATYGRGVWLLYDVTSHFSTATALWFGKANNDSAPDASLLTGNRPLEKFGMGTLTLSGPATYSGGTFIYGGTVAVGLDAALGDPSGQIGIDTGTLRAISSFSTARTVAFGVDGGGVDVGDGLTLTANGLWAAQGPVNKTGAGTLALENLGFFQAFNVNAGSLQVDNVFNGTSLQIAPGATLTGTGQIAAPTTVSGTLAPGDAPGVLTFTAPLILSSSATLRIAIDGAATGGGAGTYAQIVVNGASLTVGGTLQPFFRGISGGNNNFTPALGQQFLIATATGGVTGQFAGVDLTNSGLPSSLRMDTLYGATYVDLITTPASYQIPLAGTYNVNQQSVGAALDLLRPAAGTISSNTALQNAFNALYLLPPSQVGSVLSGLSGQEEAKGVAAALDTADALHVALQDHLLGGPQTAGFNNLSFALDGATRNLHSAFNSIAKPAAGDRSSRAGSAGSTSAAIEPTHWWSSVFYQSNMTSTSAGITGGATNISGFIAGLEGDVKPGQLLGIAASFSHTDANGLGSGSGDSFAVAGYARRTAGPLQLAAYGGAVVSSIALHHDFQTGTPIANQSGGATSLIAGTSIAYAFKLGSFQVAPTATLAFTHMLFDGTALTSPLGFAFSVPQQWTDRVRFTLGPTVTRSMVTAGGTKLFATASAGFLYQSAPVTSLDALVFTAPTVAQTAPAGGAGAFADLGVYTSLTNWLTGFIRWHGETRAHANSNQVSGGLSATF